MGNPTARITAPDFVSPPEFAGLRLAASVAGRIGGARLGVRADKGKTSLSTSYQQVPLRVLEVSLGNLQPALVYLINPTAGLFDGDAHLVHLHVGAGSRAFITGQSATRIHPALHGYSTQQWHVTVDAGAILVVLPGPTIPFAGCRYYQKAVIDLAEGAHLIWGDIWLPGRYARGTASERFQFHTLIQELTVRQAGRLVYRDRFCWQGPWDEATAQWHFGGKDAYGCLFATLLDAEPGVEQGPLRTARFLTAAKHSSERWLGPAQEVTGALTLRALSLAARAEGKTDAWLLGTHELAPNHWFSRL